MGFKVGANKFADMDHTEYTKRLGAKKPEKILTGTEYTLKAATVITTTTVKPTTTAIPDTLDWRTKNGGGAISPVKDQGSCGSCWTFSTTGALEGRYFAKYNKSISLSEQQVLDCVGDAYYCYGCDGGWPTNAFVYAYRAGGVNTEAAYPYKMAQGTCNTTNGTSVQFAKPISPVYVNVQTLNDNAGMLALQGGPLFVAIDAGQDSFGLYTSGIYNDPACTTDVNHAVLLIGYGSENGKLYWILKNSWNTDWGEQGFFRMARGNNTNTCGVLSYPSYPVVA